MSCELAGCVGVAVDGRELGDLAGGERLGLGGADLLLAEAVADAAAVRVADLVLRRAAPAPTRTARRARTPTLGAADARRADAPPGVVQAAASTAIAARPRAAVSGSIP